MVASSTVYGLLSQPIDARIAAIRAGFPSKDVALVCAALGIERAELCHVIGIAHHSTAKPKLGEGHRLDPTASERLLRIVEIEQRTQEVLGNQVLAREWLTTYNSALGVAPIHLLDTEVGGNLVRSFLVAIEQGLPV